MPDDAGGPGTAAGVAVALPRRPLAMRNPVRRYDWGSRSALSRLQSRPVQTEPEAELWMGGYPGAPSSVDVDGEAVPLPPDLPYLFKVLAVERALSVQVHPDHKRAAQRFAAGAPAYVDASGKPELLHALTPFQAMAGFRDAAGAARLAALLDVDGLDLDGGPAAALARLVHRPPHERVAMSRSAIGRASALLADADLDDEARRVLAVVVRLGHEHPGDALVVAPVLLHLHHLPAGGTIALPAGVPHAYLAGLAVELMAASDNVLRAGLTTKAVDPDELLACLRPQAAAVVGPAVPGTHVWHGPDGGFALARVVVDGPTPVPDLPGPHVVLATRGAVTVRTEGGRSVAAQGFSVFVPAGCGPVTLDADRPAEAFVAAPGGQ